ncbi:hypothetical protein BV898_03762 [Hypsibius exemplaris]|uniref:Axin-1 n=1 Tax=Hypsibius exemplaris TaxID=2072580 RepID=A0A1W0X439_HYPEX|nr:hypothetical protein BV898_03762 [Hypsibius exemplaris]
MDRPHSADERSPQHQQEDSDERQSAGGRHSHTGSSSDSGSSPAWRKWSVSVKKLLADHDGNRLFTDYLIEEQQQDVLFFYLAIRGMKVTYEHEKKIQLPHYIFNKWIRMDGPVPLSPPTKEQLRATFDQLRPTDSVSVDIFDVAQQEALAYLQEILFPMFIGSDKYHDYVNSQLDQSLHQFENPLYDNEENERPDSVRNYADEGGHKRDHVWSQQQVAPLPKTGAAVTLQSLRDVVGPAASQFASRRHSGQGDSSMDSHSSKTQQLRQEASSSVSASGVSRKTAMYDPSWTEHQQGRQVLSHPALSVLSAVTENSAGERSSHFQPDSRTFGRTGEPDSGSFASMDQQPQQRGSWKADQYLPQQLQHQYEESRRLYQDKPRQYHSNYGADPGNSTQEAPVYNESSNHYQLQDQHSQGKPMEQSSYNRYYSKPYHAFLPPTVQNSDVDSRSATTQTAGKQSSSHRQQRLDTNNTYGHRHNPDELDLAIARGMAAHNRDNRSIPLPLTEAERRQKSYRSPPANSQSFKAELSQKLAQVSVQGAHFSAGDGSSQQRPHPDLDETDMILEQKLQSICSKMSESTDSPDQPLSQQQQQQHHQHPSNPSTSQPQQRQQHHPSSSFSQMAIYPSSSATGFSAPGSYGQPGVRPTYGFTPRTAGSAQDSRARLRSVAFSADVHVSAQYGHVSRVPSHGSSKMQHFSAQGFLQSQQSSSSSQQSQSYVAEIDSRGGVIQDSRSSPSSRSLLRRPSLPTAPSRSQSASSSSQHQDVRQQPAFGGSGGPNAVALVTAATGRKIQPGQGRSASRESPRGVAGCSGSVRSSVVDHGAMHTTVLYRFESTSVDYFMSMLKGQPTLFNFRRTVLSEAQRLQNLKFFFKVDMGGLGIVWQELFDDREMLPMHDGRITATIVQG